MKKRKKTEIRKLMEEQRRKDEINSYGKLVSLRPSKVMSSKKQYSRPKDKFKYNGNED